MPAQHDTPRRDLIAGWQEAFDGLAHDGLRVARAASVPPAALWGDSVLLLRSGLVVCHSVRALDDIYGCSAGGGGGVKQLRIAASPLRANGRPWYLGPLCMLEPSPPILSVPKSKIHVSERTSKICWRHGPFTVDG